MNKPNLKEFLDYFGKIRFSYNQKKLVEAYLEYRILHFEMGLGSGRTTAINSVKLYLEEKYPCTKSTDHSPSNKKYSFFKYSRGLGKTYRLVLRALADASDGKKIIIIATHGPNHVDYIMKKIKIYSSDIADKEIINNSIYFPKGFIKVITISEYNHNTDLIRGQRDIYFLSD